MSNWYDLYAAAYSGNKNDVDYYLKLLKGTEWASQTEEQKVQLTDQTFIENVSPILAAVLQPGRNSGENAFAIASQAYSDAGIVAINTINSNCMAAAYYLLVNGSPDSRVWVRKLAELAIKNDAMKDEGWSTPTSVRIFREFIHLRNDHPYTVGRIAYAAMTFRPYSIQKILRQYGNVMKVHTALKYVIKIWSLIGNGPSTFQVRKMFKYDSHAWGEHLVDVLGILDEYGYDFNAKYISQTTNEPVFFSILDACANLKTLRKPFVKLLLSGRIDTNMKCVTGNHTLTVDQELQKINDSDLSDAVKAWRHVEKLDIKQLCDNSDNYYVERARTEKLKSIAYQAQLREKENIDSICSCVKNIIKGKKSGVFPLETIMKQRFDRKCDNVDTLGLVNLSQVASDQLINYTDTRITTKDDDGQSTHPKYCFDVHSTKELLYTGKNPYTNAALPDKFTDTLMDMKPAPEANSLEDVVADLTVDGKLGTNPTMSDFVQVLQRFKHILSQINPYLNYEEWANDYSVEDYREDIPDVGFPGFVAALDLGVVDILLPRREYVTELMAVLLNRMEKGDTSVKAVLAGVHAMLEYLKPKDSVTDAPADPYEGLSKEELEEAKKVQMQKFVASGMKDKDAMQKVQQLRQKLLALSD